MNIIYKSFKITAGTIAIIVLIIIATIHFMLLGSGNETESKHIETQVVNAETKYMEVETIDESANDIFFDTYSKTEALMNEYDDINIKKNLKENTKVWSLNKSLKKARIKKAKSMSLIELERNGYIDELCKKHGMSKVWFDRISRVESGYGANTPSGSYNAWGWGIYGNKVAKLGDNWYEASEYYIQSFVEKYGSKPNFRSMRRYCPSGAYDKYFR